MSLIRLPASLHGAFRLVAGGGTVFLFYVSLVYLLEPRPDEAAQIYDFAVLIGFEFILNPLNLMLLMLSRSLLGKIGVVVFFAGFVVSFAMLMIDAQAIKFIIASVLVGHFLPFVQRSDEASMQASGAMALRIMWYFVVMMGCAFGGALLPRMGLDEAWLQASRYDEIRRHGGLLLEQPYIAAWIGAIYYGGILAGQLSWLMLAIPPLRRGADRLGAWAETSAARMEQAKQRRRTPDPRWPDP
ncbi:hypothetical protein [Luteimonas aquatica]|uniref:hypothetical protein n=1 Tax=Luteimonas aquatica TaxID=450364 RepID=UPI001F5AC08E|nr:hypothetical protein [Luteimonas aquatica]